MLMKRKNMTSKESEPQAFFFSALKKEKARVRVVKDT